VSAVDATCRSCGAALRPRSLICVACGTSVKPVRERESLVMLVPGIILFLMLLVVVAFIASGLRG
jgi:hypothetical protein